MRIYTYDRNTGQIVGISRRTTLANARRITQEFADRDAAAGYVGGWLAVAVLLAGCVAAGHWILGVGW